MNRGWNQITDLARLMDKKNVFDFDMKEFRPPRISGKLIATVVLGFLLLVTLFGCFYQVQPEEVGIVLRFGKYVRAGAAPEDPLR